MPRRWLEYLMCFTEEERWIARKHKQSRHGLIHPCLTFHVSSHILVPCFERIKYVESE